METWLWVSLVAVYCQIAYNGYQSYRLRRARAAVPPMDVPGESIILMNSDGSSSVLFSYRFSAEKTAEIKQFYPGKVRSIAGSKVVPCAS